MSTLRSLPLSLLLLATLPSASRAEGVEADFSKAEQQLFPESPSMPTSDTAASLLLNAAKGKIETKQIPVRGGEKYRLQLTASVSGDFVIEKNARAHQLTLAAPRQGLTNSYEVLFYDKEGKVIAPPRQWEQRPGGFFLTEQPQKYTSVFYAPKECVGLKVAFQQNRRDTHLHHLSLQQETEEGTINPNPDFRYGELSYSGWTPQRAGRLYLRPDGSVIFDSGYGGTSPSFPLEPGKRYTVSARGDMGTINLNYLDTNGKQIASRHLLRLEAGKESHTEMIPPDGAALGVLVFYENALLHEVRITATAPK